MGRRRFTLAEAHPDIARQWHPKKNGDLNPEDVTYRSARGVWWRCTKDPSHEWHTSVAHRTKVGTGCPFCSGRKASKKHSLAGKFPRVAREWHPTRNGSLKPQAITPFSSRRVWWRCPQVPAHVWRTAVRHRTADGQGCPICSGHHGTPANTRPFLSGALARQWHPTKNGALRPGQVRIGSQRKVWWRCRKAPDHVWLATVGSRALSGNGCPYCRRLKVDPKRCLAKIKPSIAREWHPTRNGKLTPRDILVSSERNVWWLCPRGDDHEWRAQVGLRALEGHRCPFCINQRVSKTNMLATTHPALVAEWHPTKNHTLTPWTVVAGSNRRAWWRCKRGPDHEWSCVVRQRAIDGQGCPFCVNQRLSVTNSLQTRFPAVAEQWHPTKNGGLTPSSVVATSAKRVWWRCPAGPDHEWKTIIAHRTRNESGCPYCCGHRASVTNSLASLLPDVAAEWHPRKNGRLTPKDVTLGSSRRVWWKCARGPDHEWDAVINKRVRSSGSCPFCDGRRASLTNSLASLFPEIAREWHPSRNGSIRPDQVVAGDSWSRWWLCPRGHSWRASPRARISSGRACPVCAVRLVGQR